jgi:hypothetical protein
MRYVVLRDDDTNALTPVNTLDRLYRPFLEHGLPVNLAVIPNVRSDITYGAGIPEGFLVAKNGTPKKFVPIGENQELVDYLLANRGFHVLQHGFTHEFVEGRCEFELQNIAEAQRRIETGRRLLREAGLPEPETFVAPYDRFTRASLAEVTARFRVVSASWFELRKLPYSWWPRYIAKKLRRAAHWRIGNAVLLSHPGCHLSYHHRYDTILHRIKSSLQQRRLTILVTHWWEFFRNNQPDENFIAVLHETAEFLRNTPDIKVVTFRDIAEGKVPLN